MMHWMRDLLFQGCELGRKSQIIPNIRRNTGIFLLLCVWIVQGCLGVFAEGELFRSQGLGQEEAFPGSNSMRSAARIPPGLPGNSAGTGPTAGNNNLVWDSPKEGWASLFLAQRIIPESRREFGQGQAGVGKAGRCPCHGGVWSWVRFKVPSHPNHSGIQHLVFLLQNQNLILQLPGKN